jgi:hypothetical protein
MITLEKLKEYEEFRGFYDGFYIQKIKRGKNITTGDEWNLITSLAQDIRFEQKKLASETFIKALNNKLGQICDNYETIEYLRGIAAKGW